MSPQSGHSSDPSHPPLSPGLLQNPRIGSPCPTFAPLVYTLHRAARGSFNNVQLLMSLLGFPSQIEANSPFPPRSTRRFRIWPSPPFPCMQPASHTGFNHTRSCLRASDLLAPCTRSLSWFLAVQVLARCFLLREASLTTGAKQRPHPTLPLTPSPSNTYFQLDRTFYSKKLSCLFRFSLFLVAPSSHPEFKQAP